MNPVFHFEKKNEFPLDMACWSGILGETGEETSTGPNLIWKKKGHKSIPSWVLIFELGDICRGSGRPQMQKL
jgi:hypothetical protein